MKDLFVRLAEYLKAQEREKKDDEKQIISRSKKKYKKERESEEEEEDEDVMMEIMLELPCCDPPPILPIHYFPIRRINKKRSRPKWKGSWIQGGRKRIMKH